jgi:hypothetical protein
MSTATNLVPCAAVTSLVEFASLTAGRPESMAEQGAPP